MKNKIKLKILKDKFKKNFFLVSIYNKYNYKQYVVHNNFLFTFFIIINFLYKYGFIKKIKDVYL